jgi:hypothetical protein
MLEARALKTGTSSWFAQNSRSGIPLALRWVMLTCLQEFKGSDSIWGEVKIRLYKAPKPYAIIKILRRDTR